MGLLLALLLSPLHALAEAPPERGFAARIAGASYLGDLPTAVAEGRGLFAANGLDADVVVGESGQRGLELLRAGERDFALMTLTPLVLSRLADSTPDDPDAPVILTSLLHSSELMQLVAVDRPGLETPADLAGARIGMQAGTNAEFVWWLFTKAHDIDDSGIQKVPLSFATTAAALLDGQIDAAVMPEPWATQLLVRAGRMESPRLRTFSARHLYSGKWVLVTTRRMATEQAEVCRRLLTVYRQATQFLQSDPAAGVAIFQRRFETSESLLTQRWDALDYELGLDWALVMALRHQLQWAREAGHMSSDSSLEVLDMIESGPLRSVDPHLVHLPLTQPEARLP